MRLRYTFGWTLQSLFLFFVSHNFDFPSTDICINIKYAQKYIIVSWELPFLQYYSSCLHFYYAIFTGCLIKSHTHVACVSVFVWVCGDYFFDFFNRNKTNNLKRICCGGELWSRLDKPCEIAAFIFHILFKNCVCIL